MKVLHIFNAIEFSGAEIMFHSAAHSLQKRGCELYALSTGNKVGSYASIMEKAGFKILHLPLLKHPKYFFELSKLLCKYDFDVIHCHAERGFVINISIAWLSTNAKLLRTIHTNFNFTGLLKIRKQIERNLIRKLTGITYVSIGPSVLENEKKLLKSSSKLIPNWVDESRFYPQTEKQDELKATFGYEPRDILVLTVGSCQEVKQHHHLIEAIQLTTNQQIKCLLIGDGELFDQNKALVNELGLDDKIQLLKNLKDPERAYRASDIFIMTSKYEGLNIATLEAMSCALTPILYNVPGLLDILSNPSPAEPAGALIAPDKHTLAKTIDAFSTLNRKAIGEAAHKHVRAQFNMNRSIMAYFDIYQSKKLKP